MFGKKKGISTIDKEQLALIENAQKRIKQKKGVFIHFVIFLIGAVLITVANTILKIGLDFTIAGIHWFVFAILIWLSLLIYHVITVFITQKFMGKAWEKQQLDRLVAKQQVRIDALKQQFLREETKIAQTQAYNTQMSLSTTTTNQKKTSELTVIVAAGENNAIGKDNGLIWHLSNDLKRFKQLTNGHHIIMGRKTFESFPKPLPNRTHIVITRQKDYKVPNGVIVVHTLEDAIDAARADAQPFIIGGGNIYKQALSYADTIEITRVHARFEDADTFFPEIDTTIWKEIQRSTHDADEAHRYAYSFITYTRR